MMDLLKFHPSFDLKIKDLEYLTADNHPTYSNTRCFFVVRKDQTKEVYCIFMLAIFRISV